MAKQRDSMPGACSLRQGYAFIEYENKQEAARVLHQLAAAILPNSFVSDPLASSSSSDNALSKIP